MQQLAHPASVDSVLPDPNFLVRLCNGRKPQLGPAVLFEQMADEVVHMQALHHHDDGIVCLAVEARDEGVGLPLLEVFSRVLGVRILRFHRVIDDEQVASAAG
ncbi:hypothetical protein [Methyloceanibacter sp. wino2]|uniref:hypothetical protein n=1 Tax=Methyloceanibacter sp. wino2 TaxID=2170729 RepID=UPI00131EF2C4|nr:hypothetical protein [Methyloceanibacter sp. wino2]